MTGYREHSFDPDGGLGRPPLRPFTPIQWIGLAFLVIGALAIAVSILGRMRVIPRIFDDDIPFVSVMPLGAVLMGSRRERRPCDPEALRRRRLIAVSLAVALAVLVAVLAILIAKGGAH
jgi:hypothetical protein